MRHYRLSLAAILLLAFSLPALAPGQEILVWDHDKGSYNMFYDPETSLYVGCEFGIQRALENNGYDYTTTPWLPGDLSQYDVIFIVLGWFC
jgi:hypothetical protein